MKDLKPILLALGAKEDPHCVAWDWPRQKWCSMVGEGDFNPCLSEEIRLALNEEGFHRIEIIELANGKHRVYARGNGTLRGDGDTVNQCFVQLWARYKNIKEDGE